MSFELADYDLVGWLFTALPYIAGLLFVAYLVLGGILDFHWRTYGVGIVKLFELRLAYIAIGVILFGVLVVALFSL